MLLKCNPNPKYVPGEWQTQKVPLEVLNSSIIVVPPIWGKIDPIASHKFSLSTRFITQKTVGDVWVIPELF